MAVFCLTFIAMYTAKRSCFSAFSTAL